MIEAFFLHFYAYAEVYAVLSSWAIIPLVYIFGLLWLRRQGGLQIELEAPPAPEAAEPPGVETERTIEREQAVGSN